MRLPKSAREAMKNWLAIRGRHVGPMFHGLNGNDLERRLSSQALYEMLRRRCREAKIKACSPHDLRRKFITRLLDMGVDINTTRQLAGHEDIQTTARYDRRRIEAQHRAVARLHF